jgi:hypothetical protein
MPEAYAPVRALAETPSTAETPARLKSVGQQSIDRTSEATQKSVVKPETAPEKKNVPAKPVETPGGMAKSSYGDSVDMAGVWDDGGEEHRMESGKFVVPLSGNGSRASAAPGMR